MFAQGSRYERVPQAIYVNRDGRSIPYVLLRTFPPDAPAYQAVRVAQDDRLDLLANRFYGDPELFWRICDGNRALRPDELVETVGRPLQIPLQLAS
jgi:hypothetical protein